MTHSIMYLLITIYMDRMYSGHVDISKCCYLMTLILVGIFTLKSIVLLVICTVFRLMIFLMIQHSAPWIKTYDFRQTHAWSCCWVVFTCTSFKSSCSVDSDQLAKVNLKQEKLNVKELVKYFLFIKEFLRKYSSVLFGVGNVSVNTFKVVQYFYY